MKVRSSQNWQCGNKFLATCDDPELQHQLKFAIRSKSTQTVSGNAQKTMGGYRNPENLQNLSPCLILTAQEFLSFLPSIRMISFSNLDQMEKSSIRDTI